jgi:MFS family permease
MTANTGATPMAARAKMVLGAGALIVAISMGIRHSFGLFLDPVSMANGWGRETFALAIAVQNLVWGLTQPLVGMIADRHGAPRVVAAGTVLFTLGLYLMAQPLEAAWFMVAVGVLIGVGLSGVTMSVIFGAVAKALPRKRHSQAFGITMAIAAFGQFAMLPGALTMIDGLGWASTLLWFLALAALMLPLAFLVTAPREAPSGATLPQQSAAEAFRLAMGSRDFTLLALGFFVCGFQVVLIAVHLPAFLADEGVPVSVASTTLALIGLVNIVGTLGAGWLGARFAKPGLLAWIYLARGLVIAGFVYLPVSATSAYVFGVLMGLFWLSTIPLTNAIVASLFGTRNIAMLGGLVFVMHQLGSFMGGWLGGAIHDRTGSYDIAWALAVGLSLMAAIINVPVRDTPLAERRGA